MALVADALSTYVPESAYRSRSARQQDNERRTINQELIEKYIMALNLKSKFESARDDLMRMSALERNWNSYGAEAPSQQTRDRASNMLKLLQEESFLPTRVVPSAEGGVAVFFVRGDRYADVEFLNTGEVLAVTYTGTTEPDVWEINEGSLERAIQRIYEHFAT